MSGRLLEGLGNLGGGGRKWDDDAQHLEQSSTRNQRWSCLIRGDHRCPAVLENPLMGRQGVCHTGLFTDAHYGPSRALGTNTFLSRCQERPGGRLCSSGMQAQPILAPPNLKDETNFPDK